MQHRPPAPFSQGCDSSSLRGPGRYAGSTWGCLLAELEGSPSGSQNQWSTSENIHQSDRQARKLQALANYQHVEVTAELRRQSSEKRAAR